MGETPSTLYQVKLLQAGIPPDPATPYLNLWCGNVSE